MDVYIITKPDGKLTLRLSSAVPMVRARADVGSTPVSLVVTEDVHSRVIGSSTSQSWSGYWDWVVLFFFALCRVGRGS